MAEDWLRVEICTGLQKLVALSLPGQPAMETIELTAASWLEAVEGRAFEQSLDAQRFRLAFRSLLQTSDRWPSPRHLLEALPSRQELKKLPRPEPTPEQCAENLRKIREMLKQAFKPQPQTGDPHDH